MSEITTHRGPLGEWKNTDGEWRWEPFPLPGMLVRYQEQVGAVGGEKSWHVWAGGSLVDRRPSFEAALLCAEKWVLTRARQKKNELEMMLGETTQVITLLTSA